MRIDVHACPASKWKNWSFTLTLRYGLVILIRSAMPSIRNEDHFAVSLEAIVERSGLFAREPERITSLQRILQCVAYIKRE
jgi:hypothetical protein